MSDLPDYIEVKPECKIIGHHGGTTAVFECSDDAIGCSVEEWYPELDEGYYIVDMERHEVLDHTTDEKTAFGYAAGYDKSIGRSSGIGPVVFEHEKTLN